MANVVIANKAVFLYADDANISAGAGGPAFLVQDGGRLRMTGGDIVNINTGFNGAGFACNAVASGPTPNLELDGVSVDSAYVPIFAQPGTISVTRSRIHARSSSNQAVLVMPTSTLTIDRSTLDGGNGVWCEGTNSVARITNTLILNQSGSDGAFVGSNLFGQGAGSVYVSFSTVVGSKVVCGSGIPPCAGGTAVGSCIDNSIVVNTSGTDTIQGSACYTKYTLVTPQASALSGGGSNLLGTAAGFINAGAANYRLLANSAAVDAGEPNAQVDIDYDGTTRPQGARADLGAFEYKP